jgi:hypothetical protein
LAGDEEAIDGEDLHPPENLLTRTWSSQNSIWADEGSLLLVLALDTFGLLRGE